MADTLAINTIKKALCEPGCPLCNVEQGVSERYFQYLLGENAHNPVLLKVLEPSLGYCAQHTLDLLAFEQKAQDSDLATFFIYEHILTAAQSRVTHWKPDPGNLPFLQGIWNRIARRFGWPGFHSQPHLREGDCPVCLEIKATHQATLIALLESIGKKEIETVLGYRSSAGLCLRHLEMALQAGSLEYPGACQWIVDDTLQRLSETHMEMSEYLRKNQLENLGERVLPQEVHALPKALSWFTSLQEDAFLQHARSVKSSAEGHKHKDKQSSR